jgi:hypothetical protein
MERLSALVDLVEQSDGGNGDSNAVSGVVGGSGAQAGKARVRKSFEEVTLFGFFKVTLRRLGVTAPSLISVSKDKSLTNNIFSKVTKLLRIIF